MPAIPVMARVEAHMSDTQLVALNGLMEKLLIAHFGEGNPLFMTAAQGEPELAKDMRNAVCLVHVATRTAMRERGMGA